MCAGKLLEILGQDGGEFDFVFNQKHHNSLAFFVLNLCWRRHC